MKILLLGPQGSGKTIQSEALAKFLGVPFVETGEMFRQIAKEESEIGRKVKSLLDKGQLAPDELAAEVAKKRLGEDDCKDGFVINGYPRTLRQVKLFDPQFNRVFYLEVSDDEVIKRLLNRGRDDDTLPLIKERLRLYHQLTEPLLKFYIDRGILERIDGVGEIEEIGQRIREALNG